MPNIHEICSISLIIRRIQFRNDIHFFKTITLAKIQKLIILIVRMLGEGSEYSHAAGKSINWILHLKKHINSNKKKCKLVQPLDRAIWQYIFKIKKYISYSPFLIPLLIICLREKVALGEIL